jgi:hypothetical protein
VKYTILDIPQQDVPLMMAALDRLKGKPGFEKAGAKGALSGTNCTVTNADQGQGKMDFSCEDA